MKSSMPSATAVIFIQYHPSERTDGHLTKLGFYGVYYRKHDPEEPVRFLNGAAETFQSFKDAYYYADILHSGAIIHGGAVLVGHESLNGEGRAEEALIELSEETLRGDFWNLWDVARGN